MITLRFAPLLLVLAACQPSTSQPETGSQLAAAEQTVLARHDTLMAQMDQLYELRQQLAKAPPAADTVAVGQARRALVGAENGMMDWMHRYRRPADTVADARRLAYYARQQERIDSVGRLFESSQAAARQLLGTAPAAAAPSSSVIQ
ncbi:hypothetical protein [Hymenobacter aerophilus]|uniref:hypothetical protein n=1 Tax=Hymenobacter aerophilus TaxID=119644 RepID=UPI0012FA75E1|nr:hypothetical protein [Hymenobacter aerophilus]